MNNGSRIHTHVNEREISTYSNIKCSKKMKNQMYMNNMRVFLSDSNTFMEINSITLARDMKKNRWVPNTQKHYPQVAISTASVKTHDIHTCLCTHKDQSIYNTHNSWNRWSRSPNSCWRSLIKWYILIQVRKTQKARNVFFSPLLLIKQPSVHVPTVTHRHTHTLVFN